MRVVIILRTRGCHVCENSHCVSCDMKTGNPIMCYMSPPIIKQYLNEILTYCNYKHHETLKGIHISNYYNFSKSKENLARSKCGQIIMYLKIWRFEKQGNDWNWIGLILDRTRFIFMSFIHVCI